MKDSFFEPLVGDSYHNGINGKKVLALGASFYGRDELVKAPGKRLKH